jgi:hypothetical protein
MCKAHSGGRDAVDKPDNAPNTYHVCSTGLSTASLPPEEERPEEERPEEEWNIMFQAAVQRELRYIHVQNRPAAAPYRQEFAAKCRDPD